MQPSVSRGVLVTFGQPLDGFHCKSSKPAVRSAFSDSCLAGRSPVEAIRRYWSVAQVRTRQLYGAADGISAPGYRVGLGDSRYLITEYTYAHVVNRAG